MLGRTRMDSEVARNGRVVRGCRHGNYFNAMTNNRILISALDRKGTREEKSCEPTVDVPIFSGTPEPFHQFENYMHQSQKKEWAMVRVPQ